MEAMEIMKKLQEPFPAEDIEWRVGSTNSDKTKGIALAYVTNRAIMNRLDSIFGPFGWKNEFREWKGTSQLCGLSVKIDGEWITKWDGADDSQTEAVKGGLSDAMKRAGYQWGIGRYLYNLENSWVPIKQVGKSYALVSEPELPPWALPEGYQYPEGKKNKPFPEQPSSKSANDQVHTDIPPQTLKSKYQLVNESMDGFEQWVKEQQESGKNFRTMEQALQTELEKRRKPQQNSGNVVSRVYKLREEMGWSWDDLSSFASEVLTRKVKYLKNDVLQEEWPKIEEQMLITKSSMTG